MTKLTENDVTPEALYLKRRHFIGLAAGSVAGLSMPALSQDTSALKYKPDALTGRSDLTSLRAIAGYNNFYEFGTGKGDPAEEAWRLQTDPWNVEVTGRAAKTGTFAFEDLIDMNALEERIYRLRCVEAWSMVIPWIGVPLASVIKKLEPTTDAHYVSFETLADRKQMPGIRARVIDWPYVEGLRMDEAMNPLTILAVGLYGKTLPNQNGAPMRLVVPWKYGFKSIKSIVKIGFTKNEPPTSWNKMQPSEYGFYSNVNPEINHPRWSQATERRIGEFGRRETLMFNGYEEQVTDMYRGMDLSKYY